ncbi:methyltransferase family protein [Parasporobacterium paucivorans]|uniref:Protein-S-isoprenylcysteine O-methyltransferase Ste14 n=1 Tax=Parasporobacterium paucivorans DSM 15970 TaxID=1122934 RepID=A0A1M6GZT5_9FIRM|nr:hypothetical protein [Parasporobacterium paucivorans]SHJ15415.1 Protein-S-isoprenylcysteine O-methyltransferase Ste14 [Parasporobacterium paucivorans DSM 15970]
MIYLLLGLAAFLLFFLYDINQIILKKTILSYSFFGGSSLLIVSTSGIFLSERENMLTDMFRTGICAALALVFLILLIYTLFFALPFKDTYVEKTDTLKVCDEGVYALCRHPGVIFFFLFYVSAAFAVQIPLFWAATGMFNVLNILYALFQDRWTFMKLFENYDEYQKNTPFLIPNLKSIKKCIQIL